MFWFSLNVFHLFHLFSSNGLILEISMCEEYTWHGTTHHHRYGTFEHKIENISMAYRMLYACYYCHWFDCSCCSCCCCRYYTAIGILTVSALIFAILLTRFISVVPVATSAISQYKGKRYHHPHPSPLHTHSHIPNIFYPIQNFTKNERKKIPATLYRKREDARGIRIK